MEGDEDEVLYFGLCVDLGVHWPVCLDVSHARSIQRAQVTVMN